MANAHTPGPWESVELGQPYAAFTIAQMTGICRHVAYTATGGTPSHEEAANARLISAAPDLLAALNRLSDVYDGIYLQGISNDEMKLMKEAWAAAYVAIAKAEGRHAG